MALTPKQRQVKERARREMRTRGRRMYWQHKAKQAGQFVAFIAGGLLFIATLYGFMLVLPD